MVGFGGVTRYPEDRSVGQWVQDEIIGQNIIPNGSLLKIDDFLPYAKPDGRIFLQSGILLGRTEAERIAGEGLGIADPATDEEIYLNVYDIWDLRTEPRADLYRHNRLVFVNYLPVNLLDGTPLAGSATYAKIRELYECWIGNK